MKIKSREPVILAENFEQLVGWYKDVFDCSIIQLTDKNYHYCILENAFGIRLGIADAKEMGITPENRGNNTFLPQIEVDDVKDFFEEIVRRKGNITFGPSYDAEDGFWYGALSDLEGNPIWVVDKNCP